MTGSHRLDPLLRPGSIAVVGASEREGSVGWQTMQNLLTGGYEGRLYAVNPGYSSVCGVDCYPDLASLPGTAEHVILALGDPRIEAALDATIAHGAKAVSIWSSLVLENDTSPLLRERCERKVLQSGLLLCGANGMGFYNCEHGIWACGFDTRNNHVRGGNVTLISHSGSGMAGIIDCEQRIDFNLAVSTGQELNVSMDQYIDYALSRPGTRAIGLFMETVRDPEGMHAALARARDQRVPVVALKVGRTELSARLAVSHSGAIAGSDDAYQALFDHYGVQRVSDMDEMATALQMFAQPHPVAPGSLVTLHDSGGERQLLIDLACDLNVPLAELSAATTATLEQQLDPGLPPVNPLDGWGAGGPSADAIMANCLAAMMADPAAAMGAVVHDRGPNSSMYEEYFDYMQTGHAASGKPVFLVSNRQGSGSDPLAVEFSRRGFPVIDGLRSFLVGVRCVLNHRNYLLQEKESLPAADAEAVDRWRSRLQMATTLDEFESGQLLGDFGIPINPSVPAADLDEATAAAAQLGYPVVMKTAAAGVLHKSDQNGVVLNIRNSSELQLAYADLEQRLGPQVLLSQMLAPTGQELVLGLVNDPQFGPLVMLGFGGIHLEVLRDVTFALPPFGPTQARRLLDDLRQRPLLEAHRGQTATDLDALCEVVSAFSVMADALAGSLLEVDINPLRVSADGCVGLDALVRGAG